MADINLNLNLRLTRRQLRNGLALLLMLGVCNELSSESVTLTTYYPAPSGVYTQMITTTNTYLARDSGKVGIGTTSPGANLDVFAANTGAGQSSQGSLIFRVNDGNSRPPVAAYGNIDGVGFPDGTGTALQVREVNGTGRSITTAGSIAVGGANGTVASYVNGKLGINTAAPAALFEIVAPNNGPWGLAVRNAAAGGTGFRLFQDNNGASYIQNNGAYNLSFGPGTGFIGAGGGFTPQAPLDVAGRGYIAVRQTACGGPYGFSVGPPVKCPGGQYATLTTGVYAYLQALPLTYGSFFCCPYQVPIF